jgi:hypothetical protein
MKVMTLQAMCLADEDEDKDVDIGMTRLLVWVGAAVGTGGSSKCLQILFMEAAESWMPRALADGVEEIMFCTLLL